MEQANLTGALIPYLFHELLERLGGTVDFDANKVLSLISEEEDRGVAIAIVNGTLRVKLVDKDDIDADEN
jgi:hypothetical protein